MIGERHRGGGVVGIEKYGDFDNECGCDRVGMGFALTSVVCVCVCVLFDLSWKAVA